ncbi:MAG: hypothetical protein AAB366_02070 [Patescibacteria group bacterium]
MKNAKIIMLFIVFVGVVIYLAFNWQILIKKIQTQLEFRPLFRLPVKTEFVKTKGEAAPMATSVAAIATSASEIPDYLIPLGFKREELSSYFQKIRISSVSPSSWSSYPASLRLYSYIQKGESINITGWKIKSNQRSFEIFKSIDIYRLEGPFDETDIILPQNGSLTIYGAKNPFNKNLRLNKCSGYLNNLYDFNPDLPRNCPLISRESYKNLSGECQSYIMSLGSCEIPSADNYNSFPGTDQGNTCRAYLNTISYGNCFNKYRNDGDFLLNEWWLWIDKNTFDIFDLRHDAVRLFDKEGKLVDQYVY